MTTTPRVTTALGEWNLFKRWDYDSTCDATFAIRRLESKSLSQLRSCVVFRQMSSNFGHKQMLNNTWTSLTLLYHIVPSLHEHIGDGTHEGRVRETERRWVDENLTFLFYGLETYLVTDYQMKEAERKDEVCNFGECSWPPEQFEQSFLATTELKTTRPRPRTCQLQRHGRFRFWRCLSRERIDAVSPLLSDMSSETVRQSESRVHADQFVDNLLNEQRVVF